MRLAGIDPGLSSTGIAIADLDIESGRVEVVGLHLIKTAPSGSGSISDEILYRSNELRRAVHSYVIDCQLVFAESPTGGRNRQSAYSVSAGFFSSLVGLPVRVVTVDPYEVKRTVLGDLPRSEMDKQAIIKWAMNAHPESPWPTYERDGVTYPVTAISHLEHLADAIAVIYAGIKKNKGEV